MGGHGRRRPSTTALSRSPIFVTPGMGSFLSGRGNPTSPSAPRVAAQTSVLSWPYSMRVSYSVAAFAKYSRLLSSGVRRAPRCQSHTPHRIGVRPRDVESGSASRHWLPKWPTGPWAAVRAILRRRPPAFQFAQKTCHLQAGRGMLGACTANQPLFLGFQKTVDFWSRGRSGRRECVEVEAHTTMILDCPDHLWVMSTTTRVSCVSAVPARPR